ncbi:hypothetical protein IJM86_00105 [bacterium]|nr:hypothetical protein [bacterium]
MVRNKIGKNVICEMKMEFLRMKNLVLLLVLILILNILIVEIEKLNLEKIVLVRLIFEKNVIVFVEIISRQQERNVMRGI